MKGGIDMSHILTHTMLGFCWWDIPALIILAGVIIWFVVKRHEQVKEEKELEDQLSEIYADKSVTEDA